ncbi:MAG: NAD(P)-dependent oxidoreductase [Burkholderiaceae bacterium]|jgi:2-hydroxy-3-oxopropionate reductase|nr:NAD(P)-dependent oxidoreductase [Burkholderiaceae bacterium]
MNLTVLGIGRMGYPMARRLCQAGHAVHIWNRSPGKARPLAAEGATVHASAEGAAAAGDIVISMLENGPAVTDVLFGQGAAAAMRPGTLFIDMASIQPAEARAHAAQLAEHGIACLDAPVSGGTVGAESGTLAIMAGGADADFARALPVLQTLGRAIHVGPIGAGQLAKLANQMIVGITIGAVAEALLMCQRGGADPVKVRQAISGGFADSRILQLHGQRMLQRDFAPRARMAVQLKDMRNALETATGMHFNAPITEALERLYADAIAHGDAELDHSGLFVELARRNGML